MQLNHVYSLLMKRKSLLRRVVWLLLLVAFVPIVANAKQLQGSVEHSVTLPPVEPQLRSGAVFNESNLPEMGTTTGWYRIPAWFAGTWVREREHQEYRDATGSHHVDKTSRVTHREGFQIDRQGGMWHYRDEPFEEKVEGSAWYDLKIVRMREPLEVTDEKIVFRLQDSTILVSKLNGHIISSVQLESIMEYEPKANDVIKGKGSVQMFDEFGRSVGVYKTEFEMHKTAGFSPIDQFRGKDMQQDFRLFLTSHGLSNLAPDALESR